MKRFAILFAFFLLTGILLAGPAVQPASAAVCNNPRMWAECEGQPPKPQFTEPAPRLNSLTHGVQYGWIEDYARFYDEPGPDARHVRTATSGFFYGPAEETHVDEEGKTWLYVWDNWLPARYYHEVEASTFTGVEVNRQPERPFGWVLRPFQPRPTAGGEATPEMAEVPRYHFIEVYDSTMGSDGSLWYRISPDRSAESWIRYDYVALTTVRERPEPIGANEYWVDVDLSEQTISAYEGDRMVYAALISSGLRQWATRVGLNQVWERRLSAPMSGGEPGEDYYRIEGVLHTLYFDGEISLHNAFWHDDFGRPKSHGCVNLAPRVAEWIYYWSYRAPNDLWVWSHYGHTSEFLN